jgi:adenylate cyclase
MLFGEVAARLLLDDFGGVARTCLPGKTDFFSVGLRTGSRHSLLSFCFIIYRQAMAIEIERKFLVTGDAWKAATGVLYRQGYLSTDKARTVRVRIAGERAFLTIKGVASGIARPEFEYAIPLDDAATMLDTLCLKPLIEKRRHTLECKGMRWEVDEFLGENRGLVVAEVELERADQTIELPEWVGMEVSDDARYFNSSLIAHPFSQW